MMFRQDPQARHTIYRMAGLKPSRHDRLVGLMDTPELAELVVSALNFYGEVSGTLLDNEMGFTCMVCHADRFIDDIDIAERPRRDDLPGHCNVRYCKDSPAYVAKATEPGPWPPKDEES